jgi:hypothetical protein
LKHDKNIEVFMSFEVKSHMKLTVVVFYASVFVHKNFSLNIMPSMADAKSGTLSIKVPSKLGHLNSHKSFARFFSLHID